MADADLAAENPLIGLQVLEHLGVDTKPLLEESQDLLDGSDCSSAKSRMSGVRGGRIIRLMVTCLNRVANEAVKPVPQTDRNSPREDFFKVQEEADPFFVRSARF